MNAFRGSARIRFLMLAKRKELRLRLKNYKRITKYFVILRKSELQHRIKIGELLAQPKSVEAAVLV